VLHFGIVTMNKDVFIQGQALDFFLQLNQGFIRSFRSLGNSQFTTCH
jgi:hypothetical protein